jgi:hypothetical protein
MIITLPARAHYLKGLAHSSPNPIASSRTRRAPGRLRLARQRTAIPPWQPSPVVTAKERLLC